MYLRATSAVLALAGCLARPKPCEPEWGAPHALPELASTFDEDGPWMSGDRKHVFFVSNRGGMPSVYQASRSDPREPFDPPIEVPELVAPNPADTFSDPITDDPEPYLTEDLLRVWVGRRVTDRDRDIAATSRSMASATFPPPTPASLDSGMVNSSNNDVDPAFSPDLMTIYYASDRMTGKFDLYVAAAAAPAMDFVNGMAITAVNTTGNERAPAISADGTTLLFQSDQLGARAIFESQHIGPGLADFSPPQLFAPTQTLDAGAPYLLADGAVIYSADLGNGNGRDLFLVERCQ